MLIMQIIIIVSTKRKTKSLKIRNMFVHISASTGGKNNNYHLGFNTTDRKINRFI